jgi:hypothetical protein
MSTTFCRVDRRTAEERFGEENIKLSSPPIQKASKSPKYLLLPQAWLETSKLDMIGAQHIEIRCQSLT